MKRTVHIGFILLLLQFSVLLKANAMNETHYEGPITIYVGEETTIYHSVPYQYYVNPDSWYLSGPNGNGSSQERKGVKIVSKDYYSCTIKGISQNESTSSIDWCELHCKGIRNSTGEYYDCYWKVLVKFVPVTSITLNKSSLSLQAGQSETLTATVKPDNATDKTVTWTSSNTSIATVDSNGKVTAKASGSATITCKANDGSGKQATCSVTVTPPNVLVTSITLNNTSLTLQTGQSETLTATVLPSNATDKTVTWSSSNTSVATVTSSGKVTAVAAGWTYIRCKANDGSGTEAECMVKVAMEPTSISLNLRTLSMRATDTYTLTYSYDYPDGSQWYEKTSPSVTWTSSNTSVATISSDGTVTPKALGTTTITVKSANNLTASCEVTVIPQPELPKWDIKRIFAGRYHTMILNTDGTLWACGDNSYGQLGDGTTKDISTPKQVMSGVASVSAGYRHTMILKTDGTLWACGGNDYGQLGDGTTTDISTPKQVMSDVASVFAGWDHTMILKTDGTLWACGDNSCRQLGDGTTTNVSTPKQVMSGVASVSSGWKHTMILKIDGTLWACGLNMDGQLGDGTTTNVSTPKQVMSGVASVLAGYRHTMILKTDGTLWACGNNSYGQLGDGTTTNVSTPKQVMSGVASVSAGYWHTMILKTDGTLWACGRNNYGQFGDGTTTDISTPKQVMSGVADISAGGYYTMMLKTDGSLWAYGENGYGQLGDGTNVDRYTPVMIAEGDGSTEPIPGPDDLTDISQYSNIVYLEPASTSPESTITLPVKMKNAQTNISGFQFDLVLPAGVSVAKDEDDFYLIELSTDRTTARKHTVSASMQADGTIRVVCYSNNNSTFSGTDGNVLTMTLQVAADAPTGETNIKLRDVVMTTPSLDSYDVPWVVSKLTIEDYIPGDVNGDKLVNVVDVAGVVNLILNSGDTSKLNRKAADINGDNIINVVDVAGVVNIILGSGAKARMTTPLAAAGQSRLYMNDFSMEPGETKTVSVNLSNPGDSFTGCQFDLYLPDGLTVAEEDGFPLIDIGSRTTSRKHTLSATTQADGSLRVVCYSNNNHTFSGEDGEILTITFKAADNAPAGKKSVWMRNITLSRPDVTGVSPEDASVSVTITDPSTIHEVVLSEYFGNTPIFSLSGQRLAAPRKGVNIVGGRKVVVK